MFFGDDLVKSVNNVFANLDNVFRDIEKSHGSRGLFPIISIPSILHALNENVSFDQDGMKTTYYKNGKVHREDGPAVEYHSDIKLPEGTVNEYWLEGKQVTKKDVEDLVVKKEEEKIYTIYVGEKEYKIKGKKKLEEFEKLLK